MKQIEAVKQVLEEKLFKIFDSHFAEVITSNLSKNSIYSSQDIFRPILLASLENTSIEDICSDFEVCSADTVQRRVKEIDFDDLENKIQEILKILLDSFGIHKNQKITLLIDITEFLYYGKQLFPIVTGTKPKNNTHKSIQFFTASILTDTYIIPVYIKTISTDYSRKPLNLIQDLFTNLNSKLNISRILGDSYFFNAEVKNFLESHELEFIFNLKEYPTIKKSIQEEIDFRMRMAGSSGVNINKPKNLLRWFKKNELDSFRFDTWYESHPEISFTVAIQLFVVKKKNKDKKIVDTLIWFSYATNTSIKVQYLVDVYKKRWGIETHYRIERQFLAKTCSRNNNYRFLIFGISLLLDSLWLILNAFLNRKKKLNSYQDLSLLCIKIYRRDRLVMTVKRFIRRLKIILKELVRFKN